MKVLYFWTFGALAAMGPMGHQCLAQDLKNRPLEYSIEIDDLGPFRGRVEASKLKLSLRNSEGAWNLYLLPKKEPVTKIALEDFSLLVFRSGELNRMPLSDWILNFNPTILFSKKLGRIEQPKKYSQQDFLDAWNAYRIRFVEEWEGFKNQQKMRGYSTAAEAFFSEKMLKEGMLQALRDPQVLREFSSYVGTLLDQKLGKYQVNYSDSFDTEFRGAIYSTQIDLTAEVEPRFNINNFEVIYDPSPSVSGDSTSVVLGQLEFKLPLESARIRLDSLSVNSRLTAKPYVLTKDDDLQIELEFNRTQPLDLKALVVWDLISQKPRIRIQRDGLATPLHTGRMRSVRFRGREFNQAEESMTEWVMSQEGWRVLQSTLGSHEFLNNLTGFSAEKLSELLKDYLPFRETFVVIEQPGSEERMVLEAFKPGLARHDPVLNKNLLARFLLTVPIEIEAPLMDMQVHPLDETVAAGIQIKIKNPDVELENLELYWRGEKVSSAEFGLRLRLFNRNSAATTLDAGAEVGVSKELNFELNRLATNLEGLAVRRLDVRIGKQWHEGVRPGLSLLMKNIEKFRGLLKSNLGERLQAYVENRIRKVMAERSEGLAFQLPDNVSGTQPFTFVETKTMAAASAVDWSATGELKIEHLPESSVRIEFLDYSNQGPRCQGKYLTSVFGHLGLQDAIPVIGKNLKVLMKWGDHKAQLEISSLMASMRPVRNAYLDFTFDLCLAHNQESLDIATREIKDNLKTLTIEGVRVMGIQADAPGLASAGLVAGLIPETWLRGDYQTAAELLVALSGRIPEVPRDEILNGFIQKILNEQRQNLSELFGEKMSSYVKAETSRFLNSAPVRGELEVQIGNLTQAEQRVGELMWDVGNLIKKPLERMISENLLKIVNQYLPKANEYVRMQKTRIDSMILNIGEIVAEDLEDNIYAHLTEVLYGRGSFAALAARIRSIVKPSRALELLQSQLEANRQDRAETSWFVDYSHLVASLEACTMESRDQALARIENALNGTHLSRRKKTKIMNTIREDCVERRENLPNSDLAEMTYGLGVMSANQFLLDASIRKYFSLPAHPNHPLTTGPERWSREDNRDRPLEAPFEISNIQYLAPHGLFRVSFYNKAFSNRSKFSDQGPSKVVAQTLAENPNLVMIEVYREILNQILLKLDWAELLRTNFPTVFGASDTILVDQAPMVTEQNEIVFEVYARSKNGKVRLILTPLVKLLSAIFHPKASDDELNQLVEQKDLPSDLTRISSDDVVKVGLSFFELRNAFGYQARVKGKIRPEFSVSRSSSGTKVEMTFSQLESDIETGILKTPIQRRLDAAHLALNQMVSALLHEKIGEIGAFSALASQISLQNISLEEGDFYLTFERTPGLEWAQNP